MCGDGSILYVYAKNVGSTKSDINMYGGSSRVYIYGCNIKKVKKDIALVADNLYKMFKGKAIEKEDGNVEFNLVDRVVDRNDVENMEA